MFRKRIKKEFPPGTFIPTPARVIAIIQLCLAFSLLFWQASQPFMGDLFRIKSHMLIYQDVMGLSKLAETTQEDQERLERNVQRFKALPEGLKHSIEEQYDSLQNQLNDTFKQKLESLIHLFAFRISRFELEWIFFSIIISILLLKRIEGARHAAWLLPFIVLFFLWDNQKHHQPKRNENRLFPTEQEIIQNYLKKPLSADILTQREELILGWNLYLIQEWVQVVPSQNPAAFQKQVEEGEFLFNVSRLTKDHLNSQSSFEKTPFFLLWLYLGWNLFFAWYINKHLKLEAITSSVNT
jgi:hypothetical protein